MSVDPVKEEVPGFIRRLGDRLIEGSNNSLMVFGTDRVSEPNTGHGHINAQGGGKGTGSWRVVVGRENEHPNFMTDKSFLYLSMKTDVDKNLELSDVQFDSGAVPAGIMKSDSIRLVGRNDFKMIAGSTHITANDDEIFIKTKTKVTINVGGAILTMNKDGSVTLEATSIKMGAGANGQSPPINGVVLGSGVDTFTGAPYAALGQASTTVMASK